MPTEYREASAVREVADQLIRQHHTHLDSLYGVRMDYVFRDPPQETGGKVVWAKARKVSGLNAYLSADDRSEYMRPPRPYFVIEVAEEVWGTLNEIQRRALVDHELCHCGAETAEDAEAPTLTLVPHELEEFKAVVARHGLWRLEVEQFAAVCLPIFDEVK